MKLDAPKNSSYAASIVRVGTIVDLPGLDRLVGVPVLGCTALTTKGIGVGELRVAFTAETALSEEYARWNNLHRDETLNATTTETGYLERTRRVRAVKMRGHVSSALLMPLESLTFAGIDPSTLREGDTFDVLNGHVICEKYVVPTKPGSSPAKSKIEQAFKRVTSAQFPEHIDTDNFWRNKHLLKPGQEVIVTQKLHGTSIRVGNVPVLRQKGRVEKFLNRWFPTADHEYDVVYGSRKVIKDPGNKAQQHFYASDIWTQYGQKIAELIPEGYILYGELVGWTPSGQPIQKGYTYDLAQGDAQLYVYRVAVINRHGHLADLSWDGVKDFCAARGLKWTPEMFRTDTDNLDYDVDNLMDQRYGDYPSSTDKAVPLSGAKTVDEGVVVRQDGLVPVLLKAKAPAFLAHETKILDDEIIDMESAA